MDLATLLRFAVPALQVLLPQLIPSSPGGRIVLDLLAALARAAGAAAAGSTVMSSPPPALPPESAWTEDGLRAHYGILPPA